MVVVKKHKEHGRSLLDDLLGEWGLSSSTRDAIGTFAAMLGGNTAYKARKLRELRDRDGCRLGLSSLLRRDKGGIRGYATLTVVVPTPPQIIDAGPHEPKDTSAAVCLDGCRDVGEAAFKASLASDSSYAFMKVWGGTNEIRAEVVRLLSDEKEEDGDDE